MVASANVQAVTREDAAADGADLGLDGFMGDQNVFMAWERILRWLGAARGAPLGSPLARGVVAVAVRARWALAVLVALAALGLASPARAQDAVSVGSKRFTESYILGEVIRLRLQDAGLRAEHRQGLGNTAIVEQALMSGRIDVYPEYTGTILREILRRPESQASLDDINAWLAPRGLKVAVPLGFNNTYALALRADRARELGLKRLSDLAALPAPGQRALRTAFTQEFSTRPDGWPAVQSRYALALQPGKGLDHGLAYAALARGEVDIVDAYSTDAAIPRLGLVLLEDDRQAFPRYDAVLLMRATLDETPLRPLEGGFSEATMAALNAKAESGVSFETVAREALRGLRRALPAPASDAPPASFLHRLLAPDLPRLLIDHLSLVLASTALALAAGVPLGIAAQRSARTGAWILGAVAMLQTVPSLAMLAILIAALGQIGTVPALAALFLYALLPIVSATHAGLGEVPAGLRQAGLALGMRPLQVLRWIELPVAQPVILSGLASAAVIGVGTATLAAFVGAGGLGERIVAGLAVNDAALMMAGALPAAVLALLVQLAFAAAIRRLRRRRSSEGRSRLP